MESNVEISDDALKLLIAEHGVRGTARLLGMDERQTHAFRQRVTRGKWLAEPALKSAMAKSGAGQQRRESTPIVAAMSPLAAIQAELAQLGSETRISIARGIAKAGQHVATMSGPEVLDRSQDVKGIVQTADVLHGWKDAAPQVKIRLDVLNGSAEQPIIEVEAVVNDWESDASDDPNDY